MIKNNRNKQLIQRDNFLHLVKSEQSLNPSDPTDRNTWITFLQNWQKNCLPYFKDVTIFDMPWPGTHDTFTYDLDGSALSNHGIQTTIMKIGVVLLPFTEKMQAQSQNLNITQQLNSGIRFIDFRITFENYVGTDYYVNPATGKQGSVTRSATDPGWGNDWWIFHNVKSHNKIQVYLTEVKNWLNDHPGEMVIFWCTFHGNSKPFPICETGDEDDAKCTTNTFPDGTSNGRKEAYTYLVNKILLPILNDSLITGNSSTQDVTNIQYSDLVGTANNGVWEADPHGKALFYIADHDNMKTLVEDSSGDPNWLEKKGIFAATKYSDNDTPFDPNVKGGIGNHTGIDVTDGLAGWTFALDTYAQGAANHDTYKDNHTLFLMSGATSGPTDVVTHDTMMQLDVVNITRSGQRSWPGQKDLNSCRSVFQVPSEIQGQMDCPKWLKDLGLMSNYSHQKVMHYALKQQLAGNNEFRFPMAIYLDQMLSGGDYDVGFTEYFDNISDGGDGYCPVMQCKGAQYEMGFSYIAHHIRSIVDYIEKTEFKPPTDTAIIKSRTYIKSLLDHQWNPDVVKPVTQPQSGDSYLSGTGVRYWGQFPENVITLHQGKNKGDPLPIEYLGRSDNWPLLPDSLPFCAQGYVRGDYEAEDGKMKSGCFAEPPTRLGCSMCGSGRQCSGYGKTCRQKQLEGSADSADSSSTCWEPGKFITDKLIKEDFTTSTLNCSASPGMCSTGYYGHAHGNCAANCYEDCVSERDTIEQDRVSGINTGVQSVSMVNSGSGYNTPNIGITITKDINDKADNIVYPKLQPIVYNGVVKSVNILNPGDIDPNDPKKERKLLLKCNSTSEECVNDGKGEICCALDSSGSCPTSNTGNYCVNKPFTGKNFNLPPTVQIQSAWGGHPISYIEIDNPGLYSGTPSAEIVSNDSVGSDGKHSPAQIIPSASVVMLNKCWNGNQFGGNICQEDTDCPTKEQCKSTGKIKNILLTPNVCENDGTTKCTTNTDCYAGKDPVTGEPFFANCVNGWGFYNEPTVKITRNSGDGNKEDATVNAKLSKAEATVVMGECTGGVCDGVSQHTNTHTEDYYSCNVNGDWVSLSTEDNSDFSFNVGGSTALGNHSDPGIKDPYRCVIPNQKNRCASGYVEKDGLCWLTNQNGIKIGDFDCERYQKIPGSVYLAHCNASKQVCAPGFNAWSHGTVGCMLGPGADCHNDCIIDNTASKLSQIKGKPIKNETLFHQIKNPELYKVCGTNGNWYNFPDEPYYDKGQTNTRCGNYNKPQDRVNVPAESAEACFDLCLKNSNNCDYFSYNPNPKAGGDAWQCLYNKGGCANQREGGDGADGYTTYKVEKDGKLNNEMQFNVGGRGSRDSFSCIPGKKACVEGYEEYSDGNCYVKPWTGPTGKDECSPGGAIHCNAGDLNCGSAYVAHNHGSCGSTCRSDCNINNSPDYINKINGSNMYFINDAEKYKVCGLDGKWYSLPESSTKPENFSFNNGHRKGSAQRINCPIPSGVNPQPPSQIPNPIQIQIKYNYFRW
jgi:hypothetical protein